MINPKLSKLLSDFFLDISKAWFVATFISPIFIKEKGISEILITLTQGLVNVIFYLSLAYWLIREIRI